LPKRPGQRMKIGVAQLQPAKGDIEANIRLHQRFIEQAAAEEATVLFFPELSLTGYEPELANTLAVSENDERLDVFDELSNFFQLTIGIGAPIQLPSGIGIGLLVFQPAQPRQTYLKQQLHADELPYFVAGNQQLLLTINALKVAPAICYESLQPDHAAQANALGADVYVACVAKSQAGTDKAYRHYPAIAQAYSMPVLMANCTGYCDNFMAAGQSAVWDKNGQLTGALDDTQDGLLFFDIR
jgi:predicted amidohydrolase